MTDIRITLLTTHHHQPKGRQIADRLAADLETRPVPEPKENERA